MGDLQKDQYFRLEGRELLYCNEPITAGVVHEAEKVLENHLASHELPDLYKSLYFCIASQRTKYEAAVRFAHLIEDATLSQLNDAYYLAMQGKKARLLHSNNPLWDESKKGANRFADVLNFLDEYNIFKDDTIADIKDEFLAHPRETRRMLAKQKCNLAPKTASFWYLCLGGKELMTLDTHNYRQIAGLGPVKVNKEFYEGRLRKIDGRMINTTPSVNEYERIEQQTLEALADCNILQDKRGNPDAALITALFWVAGAKAFRKNKPTQGNLFGERPFGFESPFR